MGQRRQVSGCSERALLINHRQNVVIVHINQSLYRLQLCPGMPVGKRLDLQKQHQPDNLRPQLCSDSAGVGLHEIVLQLGKIVLSYGDIAERAEAGGHTVNRPPDILHLGIEVLAALDYRLFRLGSEFDFLSFAKYSSDFVNSQKFLGNDMCHVGFCEF